MRYICKIFLSLVLIVLLKGQFLSADIIFLNDGSRKKGLVVEEYDDRVIFSTVDGEKTVFRKDIERIEYDTPEQNFMQLGRSYEKKGWYDKAAFYYKKALELNPELKEAREAYLACHAKMWREEEKRAKKELERRTMVMNWSKRQNALATKKSKDKKALLRESIGISLARRDGIFTITDVTPDSSAYKAGIKAGDVLAGIWGKLIRYRPMDDVVEELLGPKYSEVRVLIERDIHLPVAGIQGSIYKNLGATLKFEYEGLIVEDVADDSLAALNAIKKDDYVIAVDGNLTRYMPLDSIIALINSSANNGKLTFTIRRNINLRREGEL